LSSNSTCFLTILGTIYHKIIAVEPLISNTKSIWSILPSPNLYFRQIWCLANLLVLIPTTMVRVGCCFIRPVLKIILPLRHGCYLMTRMSFLVSLLLRCFVGSRCSHSCRDAGELSTTSREAGQVCQLLFSQDFEFATGIQNTLAIVSEGSLQEGLAVGRP